MVRVYYNGNTVRKDEGGWPIAAVVSLDPERRQTMSVREMPPWFGRRCIGLCRCRVLLRSLQGVRVWIPSLKNRRERKLSAETSAFHYVQFATVASIVDGIKTRRDSEESKSAPFKKRRVRHPQLLFNGGKEGTSVYNLCSFRSQIGNSGE
jgi:hypothetical protein